MIGRNISQYKIVEKLGEGGMGVVYKAEDTQLRRAVALKCLSPETVGNEEVKARLIREAQASASLDHPNICQVFGIHEEQGQTFIAMAYIDGPALADKIKERPLPLKEALDLAIRIAEGLQEAHEKGIVHRDIKPQNVMLTAKGQVKIMDFGLASLAGRSKLTKSGTTLGTPAYMSPEQLEAGDVDRRADIWALGCVLYEMLTQKTPFDAEYEQAIAYGILNEEPEPVTAVRSGIPVELDRVISKALSKAQGERYHTAADLAVDLKALLTPFRSSNTPVGQPDSRDRPQMRFWPLATAIALAIGLGLGYWIARPEPMGLPPKTSRLTINLPVGVSPEASYYSRVDIARNGETIVFIGTGSDSKRRLYARSLNEFDFRALEGTEGAGRPALSPDGSQVAFVANGVLRSVGTGGGSASVIAQVDGTAGPSAWLPDDRLFIRHFDRRFSTMTVTGGEQKLLAEDLAGPKVLQSAFLLANQRAVLYSGMDGIGTSRILLHELSTGRSETLVESGMDPVVLPTGHLVYAQSGELFAARFSTETFELSGPPVSVVQGLFASNSGGHAWAVSKSGTLVYAPGEVQSTRTHQVAWVDRGGNSTRLPFEPSRLRSLSISPSGRRFAVGTRLGTPNVWIGDFERESLERLTELDGSDPIWTPDGKSIIFGSRRDSDEPSLYRKQIGSAAPAERLTHSEGYQVPHSVSPDGRWLAYVEVLSSFNLMVLDLENGNRIRELRVGPENETHPAFSPDGKWIAYVSDRSGQPEVYVTAFPEATSEVQVSVGGGRAPRWAQDGQTLYYRLVGSGAIMQTPISTTPSLPAGRPREVLAGPFYDDTTWERDYDVSPDGNSFLVILDDSKPTSSITNFNVVLNWSEELKRLVP